MSKIANDGLTRSGTGCFIAVPLMATVGVKGLKDKTSEGQPCSSCWLTCLISGCSIGCQCLSQRIQFRIATLTFDCVRGTGPAYFSSIACTVADNSGRPRSAENHDLHELKQLGLEGGASSSHLQLSGTLTAARLIFSLNRLVDRRWSWYF